MSKKRKLFFVILFFGSLLYLQCGRKITVYSTSNFISKDNATVEINIITNKFFIGNKEKYARKILKDAENNQLPQIKLSISEPDELIIRVYNNKQDLKNNIGFTVTYYRTTNQLEVKN